MTPENTTPAPTAPAKPAAKNPADVVSRVTNNGVTVDIGIHTAKGKGGNREFFAPCPIKDIAGVVAFANFVGPANFAKAVSRIAREAGDAAHGISIDQTTGKIDPLKYGQNLVSEFSTERAAHRASEQKQLLDDLAKAVGEMNAAYASADQNRIAQVSLKLQGLLQKKDAMEKSAAEKAKAKAK